MSGLGDLISEARRRSIWWELAEYIEVEWLVLEIIKKIDE